MVDDEEDSHKGICYRLLGAQHQKAGTGIYAQMGHSVLSGGGDDGGE